MDERAVSEERLIDYKLLRLIVGAVGLSLGLLVNYYGEWQLESISHSYHSDKTQDFFVGSLCFIGAFLCVYNGYKYDPPKIISESVLSKVAGISAIVVAFVDNKENPPIHFVAATLVFLILAYFCLFSFRQRAASKPGALACFRAVMYTICGLVMVGCILVIASNKWLGMPDYKNTVYWGETIALIAFGVAWIIASQGASKKLLGMLKPKGIKD